jgi:hypothetical protein
MNPFTTFISYYCKCIYFVFRQQQQRHHKLQHPSSFEIPSKLDAYRSVMAAVALTLANKEKMLVFPE